MQTQSYVEQVQAQLIAAAGLGDESGRKAAAVLAAAAEPAVRLAVLAAVSAAANEITAALLDVPGNPVVTAHLDGDDVAVSVQLMPPTDRSDDGPATADEQEYSARISLRLSEALKGAIEVAARSTATSVNTWMVRAASAALSRADAPGSPRLSHGDTSSHRLTGWINN